MTPVEEMVRDAPKVGFDFDQFLAQVGRGCRDLLTSAAPLGFALQGYVKAVDQDEGSNLIAMLEGRVEGIHPAREKAADARRGCRRRGVGLDLHRDDVEVRVPDVSDFLNARQ